MNPRDLALHDRFVNNELLRCLARPQYPHGCSLAALTTVLNCLYASETGLRTQEQVAEQVGVNIHSMERDQGPGNAVILEWFDTCMKALNLDGQCAIFADHTSVDPAPWDGPVFDELKMIARSPDAILIHHLPQHYNLVCGFIEHATRPQEAFVPNAALRRWIVMADPSTERDPIWSLRWDAVREEFLADRRHCLMLFSRGPQA